MTRDDDRTRFPNSGATGSGWRWKPVDLVLLVIGFALWWPMGLAFLVWKLWNDRRSQPYEIEDVLQRVAASGQIWFDRLAEGWRPAAPSAFDPEPTGNAAFDASIKERAARLSDERRKLEAEIAAFRAFLAKEQAGDASVYERFRRGYGEPR